MVRLRTGVRLVLPESDGAHRLADLLRDTGVTVELDPDFVTAAWRKLLVNAVADLMVLTGRRSGMFRRDDVAALSRRYLAECLAVARAEGANLGDDVIDEIVGMFAKAPEDMTTSMLTDREAHRPLEWDIRNGVISRKGAGTAWPRRSATCWCHCWPRPATGPARHCRSSLYGHEACERVGLDFIDSAPFRFVSTVDLPITPNRCGRCSTTPNRGRTGRR